MRTATDLSGQLLDGRFRVESPAGRGRFGTVFQGRDETRGSACAIRVLDLTPPAPGAGARSVAEVLREGLRECVLRGHKLGLKSGGVVKTFGFAIPPVSAWTSSTAVAYVASAWLDGVSLATWLDRRRIDGHTGRSVAEVIAALSPVADAVAILHDLGGVHGALNPSAIRVVTTGPTPEPRLLDAGLETLLLPNLSPGGSSKPWHAETAPYLAPELLSPSLGDPSPRTDVYALALLVLELLADKPPIPLDGERQTRERVLDPLGRPTPGVLAIDVEPVVADVLARAVSLEPLARFRDAHTFWSTLKAAVERGALMPRPARSNANDTILTSTLGLPSVRSLDALLEAVAIEPPPRESEPFASRHDSADDDESSGHLKDESGADRDRAHAGMRADDSHDDWFTEGSYDAESTADPASVALPTPALPGAGWPPIDAPSLRVVPAGWSASGSAGVPTRRSRLSLFLGLGTGAAIGIAIFTSLLGGPWAASPVPPAAASGAPLSAVDASPSSVTRILATPPFDAKLADGVLTAVDARIPNCRSAVGPSGRGTLHLTFAPDGTVTNVTLDPPYAGTSRGACLAGLFRTTRVPPFSGSPDPLLHTFTF